MGKKHIDKEFKIEAVRLASEPGNTQAGINAILASARGSSAAGNANYLQVATRPFPAKAALTPMTMPCGGSSVKMSVSVGSVTS